MLALLFVLVLVLVLLVVVLLLVVVGMVRGTISNRHGGLACHCVCEGDVYDMKELKNSGADEQTSALIYSHFKTDKKSIKYTNTHL